MFDDGKPPGDHIPSWIFEAGCADAKHVAAIPTAGKAKTVLEVGDPAPAGHPHAGFIYGGIFKDKPIWFSQLAPNLMNHFKAATWATDRAAALPTRKQGAYLDTIKEKGEFKNIFKRGASSAGFFWLAESYRYHGSGCQRFTDGYHTGDNPHVELPVLCVRMEKEKGSWLWRTLKSAL